MFTVPTFHKLHLTIVQEIRNKTGLTISDESDASIRADGTAAVVESLYAHQNYIQRQLFVRTADEPYLYIHAERLKVPRLGGTRASGTVRASSNTELTIPAGAKLTNGKGHYWTVVSAVTVRAGTTAEISVSADQVGAAWNFSGITLMWVSPQAGLSGSAEVISIAGGSDAEELEAWRERLIEAEQLGQARDRASDLNRAMKSVAGVHFAYIYKKRRGLGSLDVAITAVGEPPTLPTKTLIEAAQIVLDEEAAFWADSRVYTPTEQLLDVAAVVSGVSVDLSAVEKTVRSYISELNPGDTFQPAVLVSRIMSLTNVTDVKLTPNSNVAADVNWMHTHWLRAGLITVSAAS
jgi:uncharacterized phage protein gp47/JayE